MLLNCDCIMTSARISRNSLAVSPAVGHACLALAPVHSKAGSPTTRGDCCWLARTELHVCCPADPEILERRYPVVLRQFCLRKGSGGCGRNPGGDGVIREVSNSRPAELRRVVIAAARTIKDSQPPLPTRIESSLSLLLQCQIEATQKCATGTVAQQA